MIPTILACNCKIKMLQEKRIRFGVNVTFGDCYHNGRRISSPVL